MPSRLNLQHVRCIPSPSCCDMPLPRESPNPLYLEPFSGRLVAGNRKNQLPKAIKNRHASQPFPGRRGRYPVQNALDRAVENLWNRGQRCPSDPVLSIGLAREAEIRGQSAEVKKVLTSAC